MRIEQALAKLREAADLAAARGSLIFHLDLAMELARIAFADQGIEAVGLAVVIDELGYRVFASGPPPNSILLAEARFDRDGNIITLPSAKAIEPQALALIEARETIAAMRDPDRLTHRPIVIPSTDPAQPIEAYLIALAEDDGAMRVADHWHLRLDPTGRQIVERTALSASDGPEMRDLRTLAAAPLVYPGATPHALHTYLSLKHGIALLVETPDSGLHWRVDGEQTDIAFRPGERGRLLRS